MLSSQAKLSGMNSVPAGKYLFFYLKPTSHADILSGRCYVTHKTPFISYKNVNQPIFFPPTTLCNEQYPCSIILKTCF